MSQLSVEKALIAQLQRDYNELANTITEQRTHVEKDNGKFFCMDITTKAVRNINSSSMLLFVGATIVPLCCCRSIFVAIKIRKSKIHRFENQI